MKQRTRKIISVILFALFVLFSCLFIYLRHNLLYESTLLDKEGIFVFAALTVVSLIACFLLIRKNKRRWLIQLFYGYLTLFVAGILINETIIYKTRKPETLLEASRSGFLNGLKLYLREDGTYQAEQFDLLSAKYSYGKYIIHHDTIYLNPSHRKRSLLQGKYIYSKSAKPGSTYTNSSSYLYQDSEVIADTVTPFMIEFDKLFNQ